MLRIGIGALPLAHPSQGRGRALAATATPAAALGSRGPGETAYVVSIGAAK
jgi:hypothetical protein